MSGKIQNEDLKSEAELISGGATASSLPNDNKIYVATYSKRLDQAIADGNILGTAHSGDTSAHGVSGDVVGTTDVQVLTNKDIDGGTASNSSRLTIPKDTKANLDALTRKQATVVYASDEQKAYIDDGSNLTAIGTGSGGINFINSQISEGATVTGVTVYADSPGTAPIDGFGGSPASTLVVSSDTSLVGTKNLLWTKSAANRQGEGFSIAFSIDAAFQSKPCTISAFYKIASGTYASGDLTVWMYDVTNAQVIQPSAYSILNNTGVGEIKCEFQTNSNSTSYRLIVHTSSTSAVAYALRFDSIAVSPITYNTGSVVDDWKPATLTPSAGFGTPTNQFYFLRREGDSAFFKGTFKAGTVAGTTASIALSGLTIDSSKLPTTTNKTKVGHWNVLYTSAGPTISADYAIFYDGSDTTNLYFGYRVGSNQYVKDTGSTIFTNTDDVSFEFAVPILGWGSAQVLSSDTDSRVVAASYYGNTSGRSVDTSNPLRFENKDYDTHGMCTGGSGGFSVTIPAPGVYSFEFCAGLTANKEIYVYKNGSNYYGSAIFAAASSTSVHSNYSFEGNFRAGDVVDIRTEAAVTQSAGSGARISIKRLSGNAQIAASEKITAMYMANVSATTNGSLPIQWSDKVIDTHGCVTTGTNWRFTAPRPDTYIINGTTDVGTTANIYTYKNGSLYQSAGIVYSNTGVIVGCVKLLAGEYIDIRGDSSTVGSNPYRFISITSRE